MATFSRACLSPGGTEGDGIGIVVNGTTETDIHHNDYDLPRGSFVGDKHWDECPYVEASRGWC